MDGDVAVEMVGKAVRYALAASRITGLVAMRDGSVTHNVLALINIGRTDPAKRLERRSATRTSPTNVLRHGELGRPSEELAWQADDDGQE